MITFCAMSLVSRPACLLPHCLAGEDELGRAFTSLAHEQDFWSKWMGKHDRRCPLQPLFFWEGKEYDDILGPVDRELLAIEKNADAFALIVFSFWPDCHVLAKNKGGGWQQMNFKSKRFGCPLKPSRVKTAGVSDDVLKDLGSHAFYIDAAWGAKDADSVYVFLKYKGKCSRIAVYDPFHPEEDADLPRDSKKKYVPTNTPVFAALKVVFERAGIWSPPKKKVEPFTDEKAIAKYTKILEREPGNTEARLDRATYFKRTGKYDAAIVDYNEVIRRNPKLDAVYSSRGAAYQAKGDFRAAVADFTKNIECGNPRFEPYWYRGQSYESLGDHDKAIADFTEAIRRNKDPDDARLHLARGDAYLAKGEFDKAIADYTESIRRRPNRSETYKGRGTAYQKKGEPAKAKEDFARAKAIEKKHEEARAAREQYPIMIPHDEHKK